MELPIRIRHEAQTPIYLQIMYQLSYLITSSQLELGQRLPTVREVAEALDVNTGTVAHAYRELRKQGLVETATGRGTYVAAMVPAAPDRAARQELLSAAMRRAIHRAYSLGFTEGEVRQGFETVIGSQRHPVTIVFAAPSSGVGHKYALSLERRLGPMIKVIPVTFDAIANHDPDVVIAMEIAYFVVTFARFVRAIEADLVSLRRPSRVVGIGTVVQPFTVEALRQIGPEERLSLVTSEPLVDTSLNLIAEKAGRRREEVEVCIDGDGATAKTVLERADRVLFSYSAKEFLDQMCVPDRVRLEIAFDITEESLDRIRTVLRLRQAQPALT